MASLAIELSGMTARPSWIAEPLRMRARSQAADGVWPGASGELRWRARARWLAGLLLAVGVVLWWPPATSADGSASLEIGTSLRTSGGDGAIVESVPALREHVVGPGDTVWDLASSMTGGGDPREMVDRILTLNGRSAAALRTGSVLLLPTQGE
ncbi:MAG: LysM peptidoglycan-binding domain-containing protein [Candidatus Nanopelagicales bacterium]|nr:LysM peptidoglycan-binding domain-containing protein [Candidatus Nanopelagicales bacterium]MDZ4249711.1 LysM peptidoglycan-binding domain-containing protein [Candidatus Nanopelagicales bacterium]